MEELDSDLRLLSNWIDEANSGKDSEARTWGRIAKVSEEAGEAIAALIGATGQNPRKGETHDWQDVEKELLDVATTALAAWVHIIPYMWPRYPAVEPLPAPSAALAAHVAGLVERAGLSDPVPGASGSLTSERRWFCSTYDGKLIEGLPQQHKAVVEGDRIVGSFAEHYTTCGWFDVDKTK